MRNLLKAIKWDLILLGKYKILAVALVLSAIYISVLVLFNVPDMVVQFLIFSDPVVMGFIFIGAIVLFEKGSNTLEALVVTPIKTWQYLWSKAIALTIIALPCSFAIAIAGHGWNFHYLWLILGVVLSSILFVFIGFIGVARVKTFNQYIIIIPLFLAPFCLPLLNFFHITNSLILYIMPTQASLHFFEASFTLIESWKLLYSLVYISFGCVIAYKLAEKVFTNYIIGDKSK